MKKFVSGIIVAKDAQEECQYEDWYDAAFADYAVHALYDITEPENPKIIFINDNIHASIEDIIESFISGIEYSGIPYKYENHKFWILEDEKKSEYNANFSDLVERI